MSISNLLFLFTCDLTLKKERVKSCSYELLVDIALQVDLECLAPGQNCIICRKGKSLKEKERIH